MAVVINGTTGIDTIQDGTVTTAKIAADAVTSPKIASSVAYGMRNKVINGHMEIDQRNNGAGFTPSNGNYCVDRWQHAVNVSSKYTYDQVQDVPAGFKDSIKVTSSSAYTMGAGEIAAIRQYIEGSNTRDFSWGTSDAKTVTLSFWVKSSLTGNFGVVLSNDNNRSYGTTYTINSANTWEHKEVVIPGDTSGTWDKNTGKGIALLFCLSANANMSVSSGAWTASNSYGVVGQTQLLETNAATWFLTGVQLEEGSYATPFEHRPHGLELMLCQRYYEMSQAYPHYAYNLRDVGSTDGSSNYVVQQRYSVQKRAAPTQYIYKHDGTFNTAVCTGNGVSGDRTPTLWNNSASYLSFYITFGSAYNYGSGYIEYRWKADAEF